MKKIYIPWIIIVIIFVIGIVIGIIKNNNLQKKDLNKPEDLETNENIDDNTEETESDLEYADESYKKEMLENDTNIFYEGEEFEFSGAGYCIKNIEIYEDIDTLKQQSWFNEDAVFNKERYTKLLSESEIKNIFITADIEVTNISGKDFRFNCGNFDYVFLSDSEYVVTSKKDLIEGYSFYLDGIEFEEDYHKLISPILKANETINVKCIWSVATNYYNYENDKKTLEDKHYYELKDDLFTYVQITSDWSAMYDYDTKIEDIPATTIFVRSKNNE